MDNLSAMGADAAARGDQWAVLRTAAASMLLAIRSSPAAWLAGVLVVYATACQGLRFRLERAMRARFGFRDRASLARMTDNDAHKILEYIMTREFPFSYTASLQLALFKTYGIGSISKVLLGTASLSDAAQASKRYEDTTVLIAAFCLYSATSKRTNKAIARMNYLHSAHQRAGHITDADLLYTLSIFVTEPARFMRLYEWRALNDMVCALGAFWKSIGDAMGIRYEGLLARVGAWGDGLDFYDDVAAWTRAYELDTLRPALSNRAVADVLVDLFFQLAPPFRRSTVRDVACVLMGERVRDAFSYPEPPISAALLAYSALAARRLALRHLALPRVRRVAYFSEPDAATGRIQHYPYLITPYCQRRRCGTDGAPSRGSAPRRAGTCRATGGAAWLPGGFLYEDIGPLVRMEKGREAAEKMEEKLRAERHSGCPFAL